MTKETPPVVESTRATFDQHLAAYAAAEAELQVAAAHREAAKLAVMRARPAGVTTLEVARRIRAAAMAVHGAPQPAAVRS